MEKLEKLKRIAEEINSNFCDDLIGNSNDPQEQETWIQNALILMFGEEEFKQM